MLLQGWSKAGGMHGGYQPEGREIVALLFSER